MDWCCETVFSTNREVVKLNESPHSIFERAREQKGAKAINQERKRDFSWSDVIKTFSLNQPTPPWFFKCVTDRQTDRQKLSLPAAPSHRFSLGNHLFRVSNWLLNKQELGLADWFVSSAYRSVCFFDCCDCFTPPSLAVYSSYIF